MNAGEAVTYVRRVLNEEGVQTSNWSDAEIFVLIETKANEILGTVGLIEGKTTTTSTSGTADVSYPTNFVRIRRVQYSGVPLKYLNFRQFETRTPNGTAPSGTPREFMLWNDVITLIPTPDTSSDTITIYGEKKQSTISSSASTIDLPIIFHGALCDLVLGDMFPKDLNAQFANHYLQKFITYHLPMMKEYAKSRRRRGMPTTVVDADSVLETEHGVI